MVAVTAFRVQPPVLLVRCSKTIVSLRISYFVMTGRAASIPVAHG